MDLLHVSCGCRDVGSLARHNVFGRYLRTARTTRVVRSHITRPGVYPGVSILRKLFESMTLKEWNRVPAYHTATVFLVGHHFSVCEFMARVDNVYLYIRHARTYSTFHTRTGILCWRVLSYCGHGPSVKFH